LLTYPIIEENQVTLVQEGGLVALIDLLKDSSFNSEIHGRVAWALSNLTQINGNLHNILYPSLFMLTNMKDFIRQEAGYLGCILPLVTMIGDSNTYLSAKECALKAVVNLALNCKLIIF
jgi:Armadillo/beta-catenin-like repeat